MSKSTATTAKPARPRNSGIDKTTYALSERRMPDGVRVLCRASLDGDPFSFGIVAVGKRLYAFLDDHKNEVIEFVPAGFWTSFEPPIRVTRQGPGRWHCHFGECMTHDGLKIATGCPHCDAARLVEWHGLNHN